MSEPASLRERPAAWRTLERLRKAGWAVAVHNDYRLHGEPRTFWLLARDNRECVKGEGANDEEAFEEIALELDNRRTAAALPDTQQQPVAWMQEYERLKRAFALALLRWEACDKNTEAVIESKRQCDIAERAFDDHIQLGVITGIVQADLAASPVQQDTANSVHCENCGCDWLDNGLNPIGCPYCKQDTALPGQQEPTLIRCPFCNTGWTPPEGIGIEDYESCPHCRGRYSFAKPHLAAQQESAPAEPTDVMRDLSDIVSALIGTGRYSVQIREKRDRIYQALASAPAEERERALEAWMKAGAHLNGNTSIEEAFRAGYAAAPRRKESEVDGCADSWHDYGPRNEQEASQERGCPRCGEWWARDLSRTPEPRPTLESCPAFHHGYECSLSAGHSGDHYDENTKTSWAAEPSPQPKEVDA